MQRFSLSWIFDRTCVKLCTTVMKQILCTSLSLCGRQGIDGRLSLGHDPTFLFLHQGVSIVLGVCDGYDRVEEISEGGIVCTTSSCLPFAFIVVLPSLVLLLLSLFELSGAPPLGLQHSFIQCPSPPQFLQVLRSVLHVLFVRVPFLFWCLLFPFFRESRLGARCQHPHLFLFQLTRSGTLRSFGNNNTIATKLFPERLLIAKIPICELFVRQIGAIFTITVYLTASAGAVLDARSHSPTSSSQALMRESRTISGVTPEFRKHHDLLDHSVLTILCAWSVSAVW